MIYRRLLTFFTLSLPIFAATDRITRPIDAARTVVLQRHGHPLATPEADRGPVDQALAIEGVTLFFKPAPGLDAFLIAQQLPGAPDYHRWLSPEQFGERFGLSAGDLGKVTAWLESNGLHVDRTARGRHWISFSGSAAGLTRAFRTGFHHYEIDGAIHFANTGAPEVPEALAGVVGGFLGLDDLPHTAPPPPPVPLANLSGGAHAMSPDDFATIYNLGPVYSGGVNGSGQRIAIVGGSAIDFTDIRLFRRTFNLPASDPEKVLVGRDPGTTSALQEAIGDIEISGAIARNAQIVYVYGSSPFAALAYAADNNVAPVISVSFAGCEAVNDLSFRAVAQQANAQGITILAGSGDWGAATCDEFSPTPQASKGFSVAFPASFPEVTAVGGAQFSEAGGRYWTTTQTITLSSATSYIPETVWNDNGLVNSLKVATGGGASAVFPKPYWQSGDGVPDDRARDLPDISLAASYLHDGYLVLYQGTLYSFGGTSASTPAFAGIVALINQALVTRGALARPGLGNINPALYRMARTTPSAFHDVVSGNNNVACAQGSPGCVEGQIGFSAGPGYDLATGLGTIDAQRLIGAWDAGAASTTTLAADPGSAGLGDKVTLTVTVNGNAGAPTGTVTFLVPTSGDSVIGTANLAPSGDGAAASLAVDASAVIGSPGGVIAIYGGDSVYAASSGTVSVGANAPASGSMVVPFVAPIPSALVPGQHFWPLYITLSEKAGVATTLTTFTFNGGANSVALFGSTAIPANGSISADIAVAAVTPPADLVLHFAGRDAGGATWTRDVTQHFTGPPGTLAAPGIALATSPSAVVAQDPAADPACQWSHQIVLRETGGFLTQITSLRQGSNDLSSSLQQLFGTTRLAPFGSLTANICVPASAGTGSRTYSVTGSSELSTTVTASATVSYIAAPTSPTTLTVSAASFTLSGPDAIASLTVTTSNPGWTISVLPAKPDWLKIQPAANTISIAASAAGLSRGAYGATLVVSSPNTLPQAINVPITFVVGASTSTSIQGVAHGASFITNFAPGMVLSVFGTQLAPSTQIASALPLPIAMGGVSATVNGVSAPLYFVSSGQLNVQVPYETTLGPAVLAVNNNGQVAAFPFTVSVAAPGIFVDGDSGVAPNPTGAHGQSLLAFMTGDGDLSPTLATGATPSTSVAVSKLPKPRLPVSLTIGGVDAPIAFVGVPYGLSGVTQINFTVPDGAPSGDQPVVVTVGGVASKPAKLTVQ